jgi:hypothetical protein
MTDAPRNLDELRAIKDPQELIQAAHAYIEAGETKLSDARKLRDEAVRVLVKKHGLAETARRTGLSQSTVKMIRGRA